MTQKKNKLKFKLNLAKQTLRVLTPEETQRVAGAEIRSEGTNNHATCTFTSAVVDDKGNCIG